VTKQAKSTPVCEDGDDADGCLCGLDHSEHGVTGDADLPPATGNVVGDEAASQKRRPRSTRTSLED
jgi:hypothetical protein